MSNIRTISGYINQSTASDALRNGIVGGGWFPMSARTVTPAEEAYEREVSAARERLYETQAAELRDVHERQELAWRYAVECAQRRAEDGRRKHASGWTLDAIAEQWGGISRQAVSRILRRGQEQPPLVSSGQGP
jgi:hypothetical protein